MTAMAGRILARNGNPMDVNEYLREFQAESQGAPTVDTRPDSPTAGQVVQPSVQVPQDLANLPADKQILEMFRRKLITKEQALAMAAQAGIQ